jgi:sRNA-binding protein
MTTKTEPRRPRGELVPTWYAARIQELASILGVIPLEVPPVFRSIRPRPLAIGISEALRERFPDADAKALGRWLARWCTSWQYLENVADGGKRVDLDGNDAEEITPDQCAHAARQLADRRKAAPTRKAAV